MDTENHYLNSRALCRRPRRGSFEVHVYSQSNLIDYAHALGGKIIASSYTFMYVMKHYICDVKMSRETHKCEVGICFA